MATLDEVLAQARANAYTNIQVSRPKITFDDIKILTKDKRIVTFSPNIEQQNLLADYFPDWRTGDFSSFRGIREMILKARQLGFSTLIEILIFIDTINNRNTRSVVLSKDEDTTENIFLMVKTMYESLPEEKKPIAAKATVDEYYWPELNSRYECKTAGSGGVGRSLTINNLHWSEVAHSPNAQKVASDILNSVPPDGNIFLETTAKGFGEFFQQEWTNAENGESSFNPRFVSWLQNQEYQRDPKSIPAFTSEADLAKEQKLRELFELTEEQLAFRRWKMREPGGRKYFVQEFPLTAREAFISTGDPFFHNEQLNDLYELYSKRDPKYAASIDFVRYEKLILAFAEGELKFFDIPGDKEFYVIGADPAEGLTQSGTADYCAAHVLRYSDGKQVATLHGKWDTKTFAEILDQLGRFFNDALLAVERNNHGHAVLLALTDILFYPNLYEHEEYDQKSDQTYKKVGYPTTPKTRTLALDSLNTALIFGDTLVYCLHTLSELMSFVKLKGGKYAAEKGCHDDRVMSLAIANMMLKQPMMSSVIPLHANVPAPSISNLLRGY